MKKEEFDEIGYVIYDNHLSDENISLTQNITLTARNKIINQKLKGKPKKFGGKIYWDALDVASSEYETLFELYTSDFMYDIASELLNTNEIYLFNDQIVVKMPNDGFVFEPHTDNQFGPNPQMGINGDYKSITCCWVLDEFTNENGAITLFNKKINEYKTIYPKVGDIVVWDGNTLHYSNENTSTKPRRIWLQVYTTLDITKIPSNSNFNGYYGQRFIKGNTISKLKQPIHKTII